MIFLDLFGLSLGLDQNLAVNTAFNSMRNVKNSSSNTQNFTLFCNLGCTKMCNACTKRVRRRQNVLHERNYHELPLVLSVNYPFSILVQLCHKHVDYFLLFMNFSRDFAHKDSKQPW